MTNEQRILAKLVHDQDQEWAEARAWYKRSDKSEIMAYLVRLCDGTRAAVDSMNDVEIDITCRLAVLALCEVLGKACAEEAD